MASPTIKRQIRPMDHSMLLQSSDTLLDSFYRTPSGQNKSDLNETSNGKHQDNAGINSNIKDNEGLFVQLKSHLSDYPYNYLKDEPESLFTDWIPKNPQYATDFLFVPFNLERSILYGMFVCLDSFLFVFTSLPIRFIIALWTSVTRGGKLYYVQKIDILRTVLIFLGFIVVCNIDTSHWGKFVKDSSMKLKMVWMCLEFMDKLLVSYGNNILGSLFWCVSVDREKVIRGRWWHFMVSWAYIVAHASFLLLHLSVLNVAIHEATKALLALLILVQFAEMKGAALKTTKKTALHEMICEDIVERFQLIVYLLWIYLHNKFDDDYDPNNDGEFGLFGSVLIIYLSEFLVDNIKHCSICNFNLISPTFYVKSSAKIAHDLSKAPKSSILTDRSMALSQSMGLFTLPLTVVVLKLFYEWFPYNTDYKTIGLCLMGYLALCGLKLVNSFCLKAYIYLYKDSPEPEFEEEKSKSD